MRPFFLSYKSISISWFMFFAFVLVSISYLIVNLLSKEYGEDKEKIEDIFFSLLISGFIGARLSYALMNFDLYKDNILSIFTLSRYNLSLIGGLVFGLIALIILSKKHDIEFQSLLKIFVIAFYFSMAVGIWLVIFDRLLLPFRISNNPIKILYISLTFLLAMIVELIVSRKIKYKYTTAIILAITMFLYYML